MIITSFVWFHFVYFIVFFTFAKEVRNCVSLLFLFILFSVGYKTE